MEDKSLKQRSGRDPELSLKQRSGSDPELSLKQRSGSDPELFTHPVDVRYLEVDQQGVVFNMWYLAYFDDAMTAFLEHGGLPYNELIAAGYDVQLVHTSLDWRGGVGWRDDVRVAVSLAKIGRTSFTLDFAVRRAGVEVVHGRTVYVAVRTDGTGKTEIPPLLRNALGPERPLRPLP